MVIKHNKISFLYDMMLHDTAELSNWDWRKLLHLLEPTLLQCIAQRQQHESEQRIGWLRGPINLCRDQPWSIWQMDPHVQIRHQLYSERFTASCTENYRTTEAWWFSRSSKQGITWNNHVKYRRSTSTLWIEEILHQVVDGHIIYRYL